MKQCCAYESELVIFEALLEEFGARCSGLCRHIGQINEDCDNCKDYHEPKRRSTEALAKVLEETNKSLNEVLPGTKLVLSTKVSHKFVYHTVKVENKEVDLN